MKSFLFGANKWLTGNLPENLFIKKKKKKGLTDNLNNELYESYAMQGCVRLFSRVGK